MGGLQNVDLPRILCFTQNEPSFVQILNTYDSHWVCVTSIECKSNMVKVYNSMRTDDVCISTNECITTVLNCQSKLVYILFLEVPSSRPMLQAVVSLPWHILTLFVRDSTHHSWYTSHQGFDHTSATASRKRR